MRKSIHFITQCLFLSGLLLAGTVVSEAQSRKTNLKKWANISLSIKGKKKEPQHTYFNLGLVSNSQTFSGWGMNVLSSISQQNTYGFQASGIFNITAANVKGLQVAGIANAAGGESSGIILSGLMNANGRNLNGLVFSGLGNIASRNLNGLVMGGLINMSGAKSSGLLIGGLANVGENQNGLIVGGLSNVASDTLKGMQISSLLNIVAQESQGVQIAALANMAVANKGVQLGFINYAEQNRGLQLGISNINANARKGAQVGLLNVSADSTAHQIGLLNINPASHAQLRLSSGNLNVLNLAVRINNGRHSYTEWGGGIYYLGLDTDFSASVFYRAGIYQTLGKSWKISGDAGIYHIETCKKNKEKGYPARLYALQPRINIEYNITPKFGLFASGGYCWTRAYKCQSHTFSHKPTVEAGIVLF